jgi:hypothetical protein
MQFDTNGSGSLNPQLLNWVKLPVKDTYYTNGFTNTPTLAGDLYLPPTASNNIFGATNLIFFVDPGYFGISLPEELDVPVVYNPAKLTFSIPANSNRVSITFTSSTGALTGAFDDPAGGKTPFTYKGVVVGGAGYGFYVDTNKETGPIMLSTPPPQPPVDSDGGNPAQSLVHANGP